MHPDGRPCQDAATASVLAAGKAVLAAPLHTQELSLTLNKCTHTFASHHPAELLQKQNHFLPPFVRRKGAGRDRRALRRCRFLQAGSIPTPGGCKGATAETFSLLLGYECHCDAVQQLGLALLGSRCREKVCRGSRSCCRPGSGCGSGDGAGQRGTQRVSPGQPPCLPTHRRLLEPLAGTGDTGQPLSSTPTLLSGNW